MCSMSMIADHYRDKFTAPPYQVIPGILSGGPGSFVRGPSRKEFGDLKRDVLEMKELLKKAKAYDERNNEPNCEVAEKIDLLKKIAALVGVSLEDVVGAKA